MKNFRVPKKGIVNLKRNLIWGEEICYDGFPFTKYKEKMKFAGNYLDVPVGKTI